MAAVHIFFDGTIETAGHVLYACKNGDRPVHIVTHRQLDAVQCDFLRGLRDCTGTVGDFVHGRFRWRMRNGSPRRCSAAARDGIDAFFECMGDLMDNDGDEAAMKVLSKLSACHNGDCRACGVCAKVAHAAEDYGVYDVFDTLRSSYRS